MQFFQIWIQYYPYLFRFGLYYEFPLNIFSKTKQQIFLIFIQIMK